MQPKIKSKVICSDGEIGEVHSIIVDPLTQEISHLVVKSAAGEVAVPMAGNVKAVTESEVRLGLASSELSKFPSFQREDFVTVKEVEIPHLERDLDVEPGEALVPIPALEKDVSRRRFFIWATNVIGAIIALPLAYPILRFIMDPMYKALDNSWIRMGHVNKLKTLDFPKLLKYKKTMKEGFLLRKFEKSHWAVKPSPELREKIFTDGDVEFRDEDGKVLWVNSKEADVVVFSGKCPHLGCAYRWRKHKKFGQAFVCPCHLTIFSANGEVLDGPSPRGLDMLPVKVAEGGDIQIIDMEFKAGKARQDRIA